MICRMFGAKPLSELVPVNNINQIYFLLWVMNISVE